jgi:hypothetical protein
VNSVDHKDNLLDHITNMRNPVVRKKWNMTHWVAEELRVAGHVLQSALAGNFAIIFGLDTRTEQLGHRRNRPAFVQMVCHELHIGHRILRSDPTRPGGHRVNDAGSLCRLLKYVAPTIVLLNF